MVPGPKARMQEVGAGDGPAGDGAASMVPGPKARMQACAVCRRSGRWPLQWCPARRPGCRPASMPPNITATCSFNGARPEGQDAGDVRGRADRQRDRASMVPGPKARMQAARTRCRSSPPRSSFNGARPEGQDAGSPGCSCSAPSLALQWCPARRPGCRRRQPDRSSRSDSASMVPGPKARMQARRRRACWSPSSTLQWCPARRPGCRTIRPPPVSSVRTRFNGARPEGQDAGPCGVAGYPGVDRFNGARPEGQDAGRPVAGACVRA